MKILLIITCLTNLFVFSQRDPRPKDQANVYWNGTYSLYSLTSDEEIKPNSYGKYEFWGTTNEDPQPIKYSLTIGNTLYVYKFISYDECSNLCNEIRLSKGLALLQTNQVSEEKINETNSTTNLKSVVIGSQTWTTENLNVSKFRNGDPILEAKSAEEWINAGKNGEPAWCYYNNDPKNGEKYGKLYNWYAVNDPRGLSPEGWSVPSPEECQSLVEYLGGEAIAGLKMKNSKGWYGSGLNFSGFDASPSGRRGNKGNFSSEGMHFFWWTNEASSDGKGSSYCYLESYKDSVKFNIYTYKDRGFSVRCIKETVNLNEDFKNDEIVPNDISILETNNNTSPANLKSILIGTQTWTTENLNVSTFRNGDIIPEAKTDEEWEKAGENQEPAWCFYNNDPKNGVKYGKLYNWYAVNDPRAIAPNGWHVPSHNDWEIFESYLGESEVGNKIKIEPNFITEISFNEVGGYEESIWNPCLKCQGMDDEDRKYNFCFTCQNKKGKDIKTGKFIPRSKEKIEQIVNIGWNGENNSGFGALPGGYRGERAKFEDHEWDEKTGIDLITGWWSSTGRDEMLKHGLYYAYSRTLRSSDNYLSWVASDYQKRSYGFYLRCIKDF